VRRAALWSLLLCAPAAAQVTTDVSVDPPRAQVGQPVTLTVQVEHPRDQLVRVDASAPLFDGSWVVLETLEPLTVRSAHDPERSRTRAAWVVVSLEPGQRALPAVGLLLEREGREPAAFATDAADLRVVGVLAEGEDRARPPRGFRDPLPEPAPARWPFVLAGALLAAATGAAWSSWRARARAPLPEPRPATPLERLAALEALDLDQPEAARRVHYEIARALREAVDRRARRDGSAWTDEEWLARWPAQLADELRERSGDLLAACEEVKYGTARPTRWAVQERLELATATVRAVDGAALPAAEGAQP
jgi:hypothetical protein